MNKEEKDYLVGFDERNKKIKTFLAQSQQRTRKGIKKGQQSPKSIRERSVRKKLNVVLLPQKVYC